MRPDLSGVLVSVEQRDGVQFLKVVELTPDIKWEVLFQIDAAARKLNTFWELIKHHA
jgi:hypothetical protein